MATLELRHLSKTYPNGDPAVRDIDISIGDGEFFVLVGPSGCGKTTALRMVAGLEEPSSGQVVIDGDDVTDTSTQQRDVAMAFQHGALYPHMTVAENIGFSLRMAKMHRAEVTERVREVAQMLDLTDVLDRSPLKISGGQQQRVAMGRALVRQPRLFLMDEPMSNLDAKLRTEGRAEILAIQRRLGVTTLYVTHDQVEAMALADRVGVMRHGRIVQCGPPTEVYDRPVDLFVAQFMGSPPMNVVHAHVMGERGAPRLRIGPFEIDATPSPHRDALRRRIGRDVAVGIRPEDFTHRPTAGDLTVSLGFTEMLGSDQLAHCTLEAPAVTQTDTGVEIATERTSTITAWLDTRDHVDLWQPIHLTVDVDRIHLFDLADGHRISDRLRPVHAE